jgi:hypothetical protein
MDALTELADAILEQMIAEAIREKVEASRPVLVPQIRGLLVAAGVTWPPEIPDRVPDEWMKE